MGKFLPIILSLLLYLLGVHLAGVALIAEETVNSTQELRQLPLEQIPVALTPAETTQRFRVLLFYASAVVLVSLAGGYLPGKIRLTHTRLQILISFVGGLMLGVALFHLLLHALLDCGQGETDDILTSLALGIVCMFLLLRAFHFHQHDFTPYAPGSPAALNAGCDHDHDHDHDHDGKNQHDEQNHGVDSQQLSLVQKVMEAGHEQRDRHPAQDHHKSSSTNWMANNYAWLGIVFGLGLHSIMDGVALSASLLRLNSVPDANVSWGFATFLAILLHKPLDAISITSIMTASGWSRGKCLQINILFALMCPLGAMLAWWGILGTHSHAYLICHLLAFSAGVFLCISLSDLLPEMQFHAHSQGILTIALISGLALAWGLMMMNPIHRL